MPIPATNPFKGRHYPGELILLCVRWYLRYALSYREPSRDDGRTWARRSITPRSFASVQHYAPELEKRCRPHLKAGNDSWRVDETYIKVKKVWTYLYRAVDSQGNTLEFLLSSTRDAAAAKRFLRKALHGAGNSVPRVINVDQNRAYPAAVEKLKAEGSLPRRTRLRQCKYLNNIVEQDHRTVKKRTWLAKGYGSFASAWRTLQGIEAVHMIRKGRVRWIPKEDVMAQAGFISELFGIPA